MSIRAMKTLQYVGKASSGKQAKRKAQQDWSANKTAWVLIALMLAYMAVRIAFPALAFAEGEERGVSFASIIDSLNFLVTAVFLPLGILVSAWRIIYLVVFCGIGGIDPFDIMDLDKNEKSDVTASQVWTQVKVQFVSFAKGLAWVVGIWIIFQFALGVASIFVSTLEDSGLF